MRRILTLATLAAVAVPDARLTAQGVRVMTRPDVERVVWMNSDRPMIGLTTTGTSERGDTLGLRIESVQAGSPAEKAGLKAGDRLQSVNGVSLRADRADAGEDDYDGVLTRRLQREVQKTKAGESVELRVVAGSQARTVRVTPVKASELETERAPGGVRGRMSSDRAVIGVSVTSTGSARDTLGVFVQSVTTGGPAEKAGIIEGDRIAAINGVSLRVAREDADDPAVGAARAERLTRELGKLQAGDAAELTVVTAGRARTVRLTTVKAEELPGGEMTFFRSPGGDVRTIRIPRDSGGTFEMRLPELEGRMKELMPQMNELRRRLETESVARRRTVKAEGESRK